MRLFVGGLVLSLLGTGFLLAGPAASQGSQKESEAIGLNDEVRSTIERQYKLIRQGSKNERARGRRTIRTAVESYCRENGVPLKSCPLPFKQGWWKITQGNSTTHSHQGKNQFSWDFELVDGRARFHPKGLKNTEKPKEDYSYGRPIYAADAGRVWFRKGGSDGEQPSNIIVVHHDDGTRAIYDHIKPDGFAVKKQQRVERGGLIGWIGFTGTSYAHLHFSVRYAPEGDWTLPIRFEEYWVADPKTGRTERVKDGTPLEGQIIAATADEAANPSIP